MCDEIFDSVLSAEKKKRGGGRDSGRELQYCIQYIERAVSSVPESESGFRSFHQQAKT
jgi:hypothetical protein